LITGYGRPQQAEGGLRVQIASGGQRKLGNAFEPQADLCWFGAGRQPETEQHRCHRKERSPNSVPLPGLETGQSASAANGAGRIWKRFVQLPGVDGSSKSVNHSTSLFKR